MVLATANTHLDYMLIGTFVAGSNDEFVVGCHGMNCRSESTDSASVNSRTADLRSLVVDKPSAIASPIAVINAWGLRSSTKVRSPQLVSGNPPRLLAITRQPLCWASTDNIPNGSANTEGINRISVFASSTAMDVTLLRGARSCAYL